MSMQKIIKAALLTPIHNGPTFTGKWGVPLMLVGKPGTAKTSVIRDIGAQLSMATEILSPGERGEGAFGVVPVPQDGLLTYPAPDWSLQFVKVTDDGALDPAGEAGVVFIDEFNTAGPGIQPALLGLTLDGRIGGNQLPGRVRRIAAMNEEADAAGGWEIAPALANRLGWVNWEAPSDQEWASYWIGGSSSSYATTDIAALEQSILNRWASEWANSIGLFTGYVKSAAGLLDGVAKPGERAFASRRSVAAAMHAYTTAQLFTGDDALSQQDISILCRGFVGEAWWLGFLAYCNNLQMPNALDVLDGKVKWKHDPKRLDITHVLLAKATSIVVSEKDQKLRQQRGEALWAILADVIPAGKDLGFDAGWALARANVAVTCKAAIGVASKLEDFRKRIQK